MSFPSGTSRTSLIRKFGRNSDQARNPNQFREELQRQSAFEDQAKNALQRSTMAQSAPFGSLDAQDDPFKYGSVFRDQNKGLAGQYDAAKSADDMAQREKAERDAFEQQMRRRSLMRPNKGF